MKKLLNKKVSILLAATVLAGGFAGCNTDGKSDPTTATTTGNSNSAQTTTTSDNKTNDKPLEFSYMGMIWDPFPSEMTPVLEELMKRTNTKIDFQWHPATDYNNKVSVTLASGKLPDMISGGSVPTLLEQGAIIRLDDLLNQYGQNVLSNLEPEDYWYLKQPIDGGIYFLPNVLKFPPSYAMEIRKDWLDNVGIDKIPETWDEWVAAWTAFKEQDANGDGDKTNEIPYAGDLYSLMPAFGLNVSDRFGFVEDKDGNYTLMYELPQFKTYLAEMQKLYQSGILDKEFPTRGTFLVGGAAELEKAFHANIAGSGMTWAANARTTTEVLRGIDPKATLVGTKPIKGPEGYQAIPQRKIVSGSTTITIGGEKKAADIMKFFNYVFSEEGTNLMSYGIEGVHSEKVDGKQQLKAPYNEHFNTARAAGVNFTPMPHVFTEDAYLQLTLAGKTYDELPEPTKIFYDALYAGEDYFFLSVPELSTAAYSANKAVIMPKLEGLLAECIIGKISVDQFYTEYEKLKPLGLQAILDEGNEAWKKIKQ